MIIGYLAFWALLILAVATGLYLWRGDRKDRRVKFLFFAIVGIIALTMLISGIVDLRRELTVKKWPTVTGTVVTSKVEGSRAFHPEISYRYTIDGLAYSGTSGLNSPGFGGKRNRLELAESLVSEFPPDQPLQIHYNPTDPAMSVLTTGITYTTGLQVAFGFILLAVAAVFALMTARRSRS